MSVGSHVPCFIFWASRRAIRVPLRIDYLPSGCLESSLAAVPPSFLVRMAGRQQKLAIMAAAGRQITRTTEAQARFLPLPPSRLTRLGIGAAFWMQGKLGYQGCHCLCDPSRNVFCNPYDILEAVFHFLSVMSAIEWRCLVHTRMTRQTARRAMYHWILYNFHKWHGNYSPFLCDRIPRYSLNKAWL